MDAWTTCEIEVTSSLPAPKGIPPQVKSIGEHLRVKRLMQKQTQSEVAHIIGVTSDSLTGWELGRFSPQVQHMPRIIKYLGYIPMDLKTDTVSNKVQTLRILSGTSQRNLGKLLGIDPSTIEGWETNKHRPSEKMIGLIDGYLSKITKP